MQRFARTGVRCDEADYQGGLQEIDNDWVLALTGYRPDFGFLERTGVTFADDGYRTPVFDETSFETARPGIYLAGRCGVRCTIRRIWRCWIRWPTQRS